VRPLLAYRCAVAGLWALCCLGLWLAPAVPMQDYPQHLFIAAVLQGGQANWALDYEAALQPTPYSGVYYCLHWLAPLLGLDAAGRVFITVYLALFLGIALTLARRDTPPPWSALWLLPCALNQVYFHGFLNFLITLPLLLIALLHLQHATTRRWQRLDLLGHGALLGLIVWFHPLSLYVYAGLAACELLLARGAHTPLLLRAAPLLTTATLLATWQASVVQLDTDLVFWSPSTAAAYLGQLVLGLRANAWSVLAHALGWAALLLTLLRTRARARLTRPEVAQLLAALLAYFALPFQIGDYYNVNARLAPLPFLLLAIMLARASVPKPAAWAIAGAALLFTCDAAYLQLQVGRESAEMSALAREVAPRRDVVAVTPDASSRFLHPVFFYLMHRHDIFYYQIASGARSPHLWHLPLLPIHYRSRTKPPYPQSVSQLVQHGYSLVFVRGVTAELLQGLSQAFVPRQVHGAWVVFERRDNEPLQSARYR
jgi:hypothetical protein